MAGGARPKSCQVGAGADGVVPDGAKRCANKACRRVKPLSQFNRSRAEPDGLCRYCKPCKRAADNHSKAQPGCAARRRARAAEPGRKEALRAYRRTEAYRRRQGEWRRSERGKMYFAWRRARERAGAAATAAGRRRHLARAALYEGCIAALDPAAGVPVPKGASRCLECHTPKPTDTGFHKDVREPTGRSLVCRACLPGGKPGRERANEYARNRKARHRILNCLRRARKRLGQPLTAGNRARIERTVAAYESELSRGEGRRDSA